MAPAAAVLAVIVSYNTRAMTRRAADSVLVQTPPGGLRLVIIDNASADGSAAALAAQLKDATVMAAPENLGFGRAVNLAVACTTGVEGAGSGADIAPRWILLINPDTVLRPDALARLVGFADAHPGHGVYGGRILTPGGTLDPDCCRGHITPWSMVCIASGLTRAFPRSPLFNPEGIGGWDRTSAREVDMIVGCFCLIERSVWDRLGGFDERYWLYGEDADLCRRAAALTGRRPLFTPAAVVSHVGGAATPDWARQQILMARGRMTVMRQHWPVPWRWLAGPLGLLWAGGRAAAETAARGWGRLRGRLPAGPARWVRVWAARGEWLPGW